MEWAPVRKELKACRVAAEVNRAELARRIGVAKSTVNRIEDVTGAPDHVPDLDTIDRWVRATGLTLSAFFARIEGVPVAHPADAPAFADLRREMYGDLGRLLLEAAHARSESERRDSSSATVPAPHTRAESPDNRDGRDRASAPGPHGQGVPVPGGTTRLGTEFARALEAEERDARAARKSTPAAGPRAAGGRARPAKTRR